MELILMRSESVKYAIATVMIHFFEFTLGYQPLNHILSSRCCKGLLLSLSKQTNQV